MHNHFGNLSLPFMHFQHGQCEVNLLLFVGRPAIQRVTFGGEKIPLPSPLPPLLPWTPPPRRKKPKPRTVKPYIRRQTRVSKAQMPGTTLQPQLNNLRERTICIITISTVVTPVLRRQGLRGGRSRTPRGPVPSAHRSLPTYPLGSVRSPPIHTLQPSHPSP